MKLIHTADLHLGARTEAKLTGQKALLRREELLDSFARIASLAEHEGAAVLIAGDLFDTAAPTRRTRAAFLDIVRRHAEVRFLCLPGNHDGGSFPSCDLPENLTVFGEEWSCVRLGDTDVYGASPRGEVDYDSLCPEPNRKNIVLLHGDVREGGKSEAGVILLSRLAGRHIDYLALGHYHSHRVGRIDERGIYAYSGTPEGRGMDEAGECGVLLLDTAEEPLSPVFLKTAKRQIHIVEVDITGCRNDSDAEARICEAIAALPSSDLARVVLTGKLPPDVPRPHTERLEQKLAASFFYLEIKDKTGLLLFPEDYEASLTLKGEFVRRVRAAELPEEEKDAILRAGLAALYGEEDEI